MSRDELAAGLSELGDILAKGRQFTGETSGWVPGGDRDMTPEEQSCRSTTARIKFLGVSDFSRFVWACCPWEAFLATERVKVPTTIEKSFLVHPGANADGVLFLGPTRAGKTSLAVNLFWRRTLGDTRTRALMMSAAMYEAMSAERIERSDNFRRALSTDLLLLDDLGTEATSAFGSGCVELIAARHNANRETWVTTGLAKAHFVERYGAQVFERVHERARVIRLG